MKTVELFVGAGGPGMGVSRAGFVPAAVIELDRYCCDTVRENRGRGLDPVTKWSLIAGDVRQNDFTPIAGHVEIVTGGPPRKPFSIGCNRRAQADARDTFPEAARVYVFSAVNLKPRLIGQYGGYSAVRWNGSGFGSNDPGRKRDTTTYKDDHFDALNSIDIDWPLPRGRWSPDRPKGKGNATCGCAH